MDINNSLHKFEIYYNLSDCDSLVLRCFERKNTLPTILKRIIKLNPMHDEQVILAYILNLAKDNNLYFSKSQIRYCFNQFYDKEAHGNKDSYLKWLYSLQVPVKNLNGVIKNSNRAVIAYKKRHPIQIHTKPLLNQINPTNSSKTIETSVSSTETASCKGVNL